jgi:hypothetical protein
VAKVTAVRIKYDASATMSAFHASDEFVRVVMGPVGSGKSSGCIMEGLRRAKEQHPGPDGIRRTRGAIVRNTYRELNDTTRKTFEQWIPSQLGKWSEQDFTFHMRFADVECEVLFRALDRPQDVKKLLSLELTWLYFNEMREVAKAIFDGAQGRVGRYPSRAQGGPTWFGVWGDTNPWHAGHWGSKHFKSKPAGHRLFKQPGGRTAQAENVENLPPGYYPRLCAGKDAEWIRVYVDGEEATSDEGSVFGRLLDLLGARGGFDSFEHPNTDVFTSWDLGIADAVAIWFWRINEHGVADLVDFHQGHGRELSHYFGILDAKPYEYAKHWLPHDARARSLQTGVSVLDQFITRYGAGAVAIGPAMSLADGLTAARWHLEQPIRIHPRCQVPILNDAGGEESPGGLEALREYRYEWDEEHRVFSKRPLHNWASHPADAFRGCSLVVKHSELMTRAPPPPPQPKSITVGRSLNSFTMDELWEIHESEQSGRRR